VIERTGNSIGDDDDSDGFVVDGPVLKTWNVHLQKLRQFLSSRRLACRETISDGFSIGERAVLTYLAVRRNRRGVSRFDYPIIQQQVGWCGI
jgi:hypothetical protein